jgi:hypothetical protein
VRSIWAAWERGEFSSAEWAHPEIEYVVVGGPEPGTWIGRAQMAQARGEFMRAWKGYLAWPTSTASSTMSVCSCSLTPAGEARGAD